MQTLDLSAVKEALTGHQHLVLVEVVEAWCLEGQCLASVLCHVKARFMPYQDQVPRTLFMVSVFDWVVAFQVGAGVKKDPDQIHQKQMKIITSLDSHQILGVAKATT